MKMSHRKFLIAAAIPVILAALPGTASALCAGPATWDSSVKVRANDQIGWGTDIGAGFTIAPYVVIGTCGSIGVDNQGGAIYRNSELGNGVTMQGGSIIGSYSVIGSNSTMDASKVASHTTVGSSTNIVAGSEAGQSKRASGSVANDEIQ